MESINETISPSTDFDAQYARVFEVATCRTQAELAVVLDIRQSGVSDAKRRKSIPVEWCMKLMQQKRINPEWILTGTGGKYLIPTDVEFGKPHVVKAPDSRLLQEFSALELLNELLRRSMKEQDTECGDKNPSNSQKKGNV